MFKPIHSLAATTIAHNAPREQPTSRTGQQDDGLFAPHGWRRSVARCLDDKQSLIVGKRNLMHLERIVG